MGVEDQRLKHIHQLQEKRERDGNLPPPQALELSLLLLGAFPRKAEIARILLEGNVTPWRGIELNKEMEELRQQETQLELDDMDLDEAQLTLESGEQLEGYDDGLIADEDFIEAGRKMVDGLNARKRIRRLLKMRESGPLSYFHLEVELSLLMRGFSTRYAQITMLLFQDLSPDNEKRLRKELEKLREKEG